MSINNRFIILTYMRNKKMVLLFSCYLVATLYNARWCHLKCTGTAEIVFLLHSAICCITNRSNTKIVLLLQSALWYIEKMKNFGILKR